MEQGHGSLSQPGRTEISSSGGKAVQEVLKLPLMSVARLMRRMIPKNGKISEEAKGIMIECVREFISFVTMEANHHCHEEKRRTIITEDLIHALKTMGFDNYADILTIHLKRFRARANANPNPFQGVGQGTQPTTLETNDYVVAPPSPAAPDVYLPVPPNPNPEPTTKENADADVTSIDEEPSSVGTSNLGFDPAAYGINLDDFDLDNFFDD